MRKAGRLLGRQTERKEQFALILPVLSQDMIQQKTEKKRAGKNRKAILQTLADMREENSDGDNAVERQSLIAQCFNCYFKEWLLP